MSSENKFNPPEKAWNAPKIPFFTPKLPGAALGLTLSSSTFARLGSFRFTFFCAPDILICQGLVYTITMQA